MSQTKIKAGGFDVDVITGTTALAEAPASTDEFLISDGGVLKRIDSSYIGGTNTPAFHVYLSGDQAIGTGAATKIAWDSEYIDSGGVFASNKFTVPSDGAGTYVFNWIIKMGGMDDGEAVQVFLYKGGSELDSQRTRTKITAGGGDQEVHVAGSYIDTAAATNYYELYVHQNEGGNQNVMQETSTFSGYRLIGA